MKWFVVLCVLAAVLGAVLGSGEQHDERAAGGADYTGRYAELASPVPAQVDVNGLVQSLLRAGNNN